MSGEILVTRAEAARRMALSLRSFERHVQPHIKLVRAGRLRLIRVATLERRAAANERAALEEHR